MRLRRAQAGFKRRVHRLIDEMSIDETVRRVVAGSVRRVSKYSRY
jgi:hypothetical protein